MLKCENGTFMAEGDSVVICADLEIIIRGVRDLFIKYAKTELGEANAIVATICSESLAIDPEIIEEGEN